jgi:hypothetical protein
VRARTVVAEFDGLVWSKPRMMRQFFVKQRGNLGYLADTNGGSGLESVFDPVGQAGSRKQKNRMYDLFRCIVGDPFHPLRPIAPAVLAWNECAAVKMATSIDHERDFSPERMGILADALEEAGCDNAGILAHLREPGVHTHGCHAVDLVLGKASPADRG